MPSKNLNRYQLLVSNMSDLKNEDLHRIHLFALFLSLNVSVLIKIFFYRLNLLPLLNFFLTLLVFFCHFVIFHLFLYRLYFPLTKMFCIFLQFLLLKNKILHEEHYYLILHRPNFCFVIQFLGNKNFT